MKHELLQEVWIDCDRNDPEAWLVNLASKDGSLASGGYMKKIALPAKPKVRLEELEKVFLDHYKILHSRGAPQMDLDFIKKLCTHLGIEIEPEKEEWEREYDKEVKDWAIDQDEAKLIYKRAWKSCEKIKGEK